MELRPCPYPPRCAAPYQTVLRMETPKGSTGLACFDAKSQVAATHAIGTRRTSHRPPEGPGRCHVGAGPDLAHHRHGRADGAPALHPLAPHRDADANLHAWT